MSTLQHTLTQLTLQEALTAFHPDFVQQSCERQRSLRERWRNRVDGRHRPPPAGCREGARPPPLGYREGAPQPEKTPRFFFVGEPCICELHTYGIPFMQLPTSSCRLQQLSSPDVSETDVPAEQEVGDPYRSFIVVPSDWLDWQR